jgi:hypothetical protein
MIHSEAAAFLVQSDNVLDTLRFAGRVNAALDRVYRSGLVMGPGREGDDVGPMTNSMTNPTSLL